jgi:hypothetical protein
MMDYDLAVSFLNDVKDWVEGLILEGRVDICARSWFEGLVSSDVSSDEFSDIVGLDFAADHIWATACLVVLEYSDLGFEVPRSVHAAIFLGKSNNFSREYVKNCSVAR